MENPMVVQERLAQEETGVLRHHERKLTPTETVKQRMKNTLPISWLPKDFRLDPKAIY